MGDRPEEDSQQEQRGDEDEHGGTSLCDDESRSEYECSLTQKSKPHTLPSTRRTVVY
ncbi:hypothetical protein GCM10010264_00880 [Streptomyces globisporus]|nr:hypothetical protein GCM10010264_00880 [Streptomyces globisporus]